MAYGEAHGGVRPAIVEACRTIRLHHRVTDVAISDYDASTGAARVVVEFDTALPSRARAAGISAKGVGARERTTWLFHGHYPSIAPGVELRPDFPRGFAHIFPGPSGQAVRPCIYLGDLNDLLHREGLLALVHHLAVWLERAGADDLIDETVGWEPIRRDICSDVVEFDRDGIGALVTDERAFALVPATIFGFGQDGTPFHYAVLQGGTLTGPALPGVARSSGQLAIKQSAAIVAWSNGPSRPDAVIVDQYIPDTVETLEQLLALSEAYGCGDRLATGLFTFEQEYAKGLRGPFPIIVVLCARRPFNLIGTSSPLELVPYLLHATMPQLLNSATKTPVQPMAHRHRVSPRLLAEMSGTPADLAVSKITQIGCGSVGSKLAMHLARAGVSPSALVDKGTMSAHNAARHALMPSAHLVTPLWHGEKAPVLAAALRGFGANPQPFVESVLQLTPSSPAFAPVATDAEIIIDSTGSEAVRSHLAKLPFSGRVVEASLLDDGRFGLMLIEGAARNPSTTDLACAAFQMMADRKSLRRALLPKDAAPVMAIGQGCGSRTMVVPDTLISLHSAAMGQRVLRLIREGAPEAGEVAIGHLAADGMTIRWVTTAVAHVHEVIVENEPTWRVRVLDRAHRKILADIAKYPGLETGGAAVGRVSTVDRTIWVTDVLDAPPDSERSAGLFVLGVQGVKAALDDIRQRSSNVLECVGTWHRHVGDHGGSPLDYKTAAVLGANSAIPQALLIRRPTGYSAVIGGAS